MVKVLALPIHSSACIISVPFWSIENCVTDWALLYIHLPSNTNPTSAANLTWSINPTWSTNHISSANLALSTNPTWSANPTSSANPTPNILYNIWIKKYFKIHFNQKKKNQYNIFIKYFPILNNKSWLN